MATPKPLFSDRTARNIVSIARRGLATALAVQDPLRQELRVWRYEPATGEFAVIIVDTFHVRTFGHVPGTGGDEGIDQASISGSIRRYLPPTSEPLLAPGDRIELAELGSAVIEAVNLHRYGYEEARWRLEEGSA